MPEKPLVVDPRMFITGPSQACPQCGQPQLGTLSIRDNVHARRCRKCSYHQEERLPRLAKKLIYLDQMVVSEIAKKLDPVWREEKRRTDDFWLEAFDQIDRLVKLQLIVCPYSPIHRVESSLREPFEPVLRRLYKHLASGVSLRFPHEVLMLQLYEAFDASYENRPPDWNRVTRDDVVRSRLDRWSERLLITVDMGHSPGEVDGRRASRARAHAGLKKLWEGWASEDQMSFDDFFQRERRGFADSAFQSFADPSRIIPGWPVRLVSWVMSRFADKGVPQEDQLRKARSFLYSEPALSAPENHLGALLFAGLAWQANRGGRKSVPNQGTPNDIKFISAYLPYCDAMFIDKEFAHLLRQEPLATAVRRYPAQIFSAGSRTHFLEYLVGLEEEAGPAHLALVTRTYGEAWTKPHRAMLEHERSKPTYWP